MQIQQSTGRATPYGGALFFEGLVPGRIGTGAGGAADGGVLARDFAIQNGVGGRVILRLCVS